MSTLGCPGASLAEVLDVARRHSVDGLELRVHDEEFLHMGASAAEAQQVGECIRQEGLALAGLASYVQVCSHSSDDQVIDQLHRLIRLAELTGAEAVRVFPGGEADRDCGAQRRIAAVLPELQRVGVQLLVETHDTHPTGRQALRLVEGLAAPEQVAVLWDGLHPWRSGEDPQLTKPLLGEYLAYFQIKDALWQGDTWVPTPIGEGQLPVESLGQLLQDFSGWVSLEWERRWHPQIPPLGEVLPSAADWFHHWNPGG